MTLQTVVLEGCDNSNLSLDEQLEARATFALCRLNLLTLANSFAASV
jgi:hypothetical protein